MKLWITIGLVVIAVVVVFGTQFTLFIVQPIGAVPEGRTLIIGRLTNMNFIESADAICERLAGGVSLLCRGMTLARIGQEAHIFARLPYSDVLYKISTSGAQYGK